MAISNKLLDLVLVYDFWHHSAGWFTPAQAARMCAAMEWLEIIDEAHKAFEATKQLAGPKPQVYISEEETCLSPKDSSPSTE